MPVEMVIPPRSTVLIDLRVRAEFLRLDSGYYLYPRSSIFRTSLRLANSVGIIDAGYRGTLKVAVDNIRDEPYVVRRGDRLFQICQPSLKPFDVEFGQVNRDTERGEGGHGSTSSRPLP
jgi:dUTP pyrophosphatase